MSKAIYMTSEAANLLLGIWHAAQKQLPGVPVVIARKHKAQSAELERNGMIERHHVGADKIGATVTKQGVAFVRDAMRHLKH